MANFCNKCGTQKKTGEEKFCSSCGDSFVNEKTDNHQNFTIKLKKKHFMILSLVVLLGLGINFIFSSSGLESFIDRLYSGTVVKNISTDSDWIKKIEGERKNLGEKISAMYDKKTLTETKIDNEMVIPNTTTTTGSSIDVESGAIKSKASNFLNDHYSLIRSGKFSEAYGNYTDSFKLTKPLLKDLPTFSSGWFGVTNVQLLDIHEVLGEDGVFGYTVVLSMRNGITQKNITRARLKQNGDTIKIDWYDSKPVN